MFSVVIPLYNKELTIRGTIQSVLDQTFQDFEILVINDGSTDTSLSVVESIESLRIRIVNKENGGVSSARNRGIKEAKYEWIAFLDGDDIWHNDKLFEAYSFISVNENVNWGFTGYYSLKRKKRYEYLYGNSGGRLENVIKDLLKGVKIHTSTVIVKRSFFYENRNLWFREGLNNSEDREVWYKLCCLDKKPFYINKVLTLYEIEADENSLVSQNKKNSYMHFLSMQERIEDFTTFLDKADKYKLLRFIHFLNKKALINRWMINRDNSFLLSKYFSLFEIIVLKSMVLSPKFIKIIIIKFYD